MTVLALLLLYAQSAGTGPSTSAEKTRVIDGVRYRVKTAGIKYGSAGFTYQKLVPEEQPAASRPQFIAPDVPPPESKPFVTRQISCADIVLTGRKKAQPGGSSMGVYAETSWSEDTQTPIYRRVMGGTGAVSLSERYLFYDTSLHAWVVGTKQSYQRLRPPYELRLNSEDLKSELPISTDSWHVWGDFFSSDIISTCVAPPSFPPSFAPSAAPSAAPSFVAPATAPWDMKHKQPTPVPTPPSCTLPPAAKRHCRRLGMCCSSSVCHFCPAPAPATAPPSPVPTIAPTSTPTALPTNTPTAVPSSIPTFSWSPIAVPTRFPTAVPSSTPTNQIIVTIQASRITVPSMMPTRGRIVAGVAGVVQRPAIVKQQEEKLKVMKTQVAREQKKLLEEVVQGKMTSATSAARFQKFMKRLKAAFTDAPASLSSKSSAAAPETEKKRSDVTGVRILKRPHAIAISPVLAKPMRESNTFTPAGVATFSPTAYHHNPRKAPVRSPTSNPTSRPTFEVRKPMAKSEITHLEKHLQDDILRILFKSNAPTAVPTLGPTAAPSPKATRYDVPSNKGIVNKPTLGPTAAPSPKATRYDVPGNKGIVNNSKPKPSNHSVSSVSSTSTNVKSRAQSKNMVKVCRAQYNALDMSAWCMHKCPELPYCSTELCACHLEPKIQWTANPTPPPTALPSERPTVSPTVSPTPPPTQMPTAKATMKPHILAGNGLATGEGEVGWQSFVHAEDVQQVTSPPTESPTLIPTLSGVTKVLQLRKKYKKANTETAAPTASPTLMMTPVPTTSPTAVTVAPTPSPTARPSSFPTPYPSAMPTRQWPTPRPNTIKWGHQGKDDDTDDDDVSAINFVTTVSPTATPTPLPSHTPSASPSLAPSENPTPAPTPIFKTLTPSAMPTIAPSTAPTRALSCRKQLLLSCPGPYDFLEGPVCDACVAAHVLVTTACSSVLDKLKVKVHCWGCGVRRGAAC